MQTPLCDIDLKAEQRKIIRAIAAAFVFCAAVLGTAYALLPRYFAFPGALADRIAFALQADVFVFLCIVWGVRLVAKGRFRSAADNRGSAYAPPSAEIGVPVAFLQNTLEQAIVAVGS